MPPAQVVNHPGSNKKNQGAQSKALGKVGPKINVHTTISKYIDFCVDVYIIYTHV